MKHTRQPPTSALEGKLVASIPKVAEALDVDESTIYRYVRQGKLKKRGHGRGARIVVASVYAYLEQET